MQVGTKDCMLYTLDASHTLSPRIPVIRDLGCAQYVQIVKGCARQNSEMIANDLHLCVVFWVEPLGML